MHLRQIPILGFLLNPTGRMPREIALVESGLSVDDGRKPFIPFDRLANVPTVRNGLFSSIVTLPVDRAPPVVVRGVPRASSKAFATAVEEAWKEFNLSKLRRETDRIDRLLRKIGELSDPARYPSACSLQPVLKDVRDLDNSLLRKLPMGAIGSANAAKLKPIHSFLNDPKAKREEAITRFVEKELFRRREFLDTIEAKPLTAEQRLSIVVDEDATLVLAGAGSGKTSVITAKSAYLLKAGIRAADEILLLAFTKPAAREMSERIEMHCGASVQAYTFHALAYRIIGAVEGSKPPVAPHATDEAIFLALIKRILRDLVSSRTEVARAIVDWFAHFLVEPKSEWDFETKRDYYIHIEEQDLRTLRGESVKSHEELQIANWLYKNGIAYEYEPTYEHPLPKTGRRDYTPDFRLSESGIYIEHFGVRRECLPNGEERLTTAPFVDRDRYLDDMEWKREVHAANGTILIETYSYERQEGRLLEALAEKLAPHVIPAPLPPETIYDRVIELKQVDGFSRLLGTFLRKFKSGDYSIEDCRNTAETLELGRRAGAFLAVFEPAHQEYQKCLGDRLDFEDMILRATRHIENGRYHSPFRHILVDEFQDISQDRARLIKALKALHEDVRIFAVGDDWQSIYRYAGADIHLMRNFGHEFGGRFADEDAIHRTVDLGRTFRSVDRLALAAKRFVLRNPAQIDKIVIPAGEAKEPAIHVVWTNRDNAGAQLEEALARLAGQPSAESRKTTVLLLGRYRHVAPDIADLRRKFPGLSIDYRTIHASKGLEEDHVILLRADGGRTGFPSKIVDDPLLALVSPEAEPFENAEERRVMYVAMTRARHTLTILASKDRPSSFVRELCEDSGYGIGPCAKTKRRIGNREGKTMAGAVNKVILVGNLGADPEIRQTKDGRPVANLSLATNETWKDRNTGERRERTEWHRVIIFSEGLCRVAENYLKKGSKVYLEGQLQTRKWQDQSGADRYTTEVVLQNFNSSLVMLDSRAESEARGSYGQSDYGDPGPSGPEHDSSGDAEGGSAGSPDQSGSGGSGSSDQEGDFSRELDDEIPF